MQRSSLQIYWASIEWASHMNVFANSGKMVH
jgi:hypothetical protein